MNKEEIRKALEGKGAVMEIGSPNDGYARFSPAEAGLPACLKTKIFPCTT